MLYAVPAFILVLTVIVFVHEMGHYLVARWNGVAIQTFSLGFGPEIVGFNDRHGTRWKISVIPLGGFVRFVGDMNAASMPDPDAADALPPEEQHRLFVNKNVWQRIAVVAAGPIANVIFTFVVLYGLLMAYGQYVIPPVVGDLTWDGPALHSGILPGDRVTSVDGFDVRSFDDFQRFVATAPGRPVTIVVERGASTRTFVLTPAIATETDQFGNTHRIGRIGISRNVEQGDVTLYRPNPVEAVGMTGEQINFIVNRTVAFLGDYFVGRGDPEQLGGPLKVAKVSGEVATLGIVALINLAALLSLNIGLFNLLPVPVLDGGHLLYYIIEAVRGRALGPKAQEWGFRVGFAIVGTLMVFTLLNDTLFEALRHVS